MTDFTAARRMMVDGQIRPSDVTDLRIIAAMLEVERERFVPVASASIAYLDRDVPVGPGNGGRVLLKPMVLAKLLHAAEIARADRVLDVGCATGYSSAVLSRLSGEVVALEEDAALARQAAEALRSIPTVKIVTGALAQGWPAGAPYDVIILNGATEVTPDPLLRQLKEGGRLVCVLGGGLSAKAMLYCRSSNDFGGRAIFDAAGRVLPGFAKPPAFAF